MKTSSAKQKGRSLQKWVSDQISKITGIQNGKDELIDSRGMGQSGTDIILIGEAKKLFPYSVECKKQEKWSIHEYIKQAQANTIDGTDWLLVLSKNRSKPVVVMDAEVFFNLQKKVINKNKK